MLLKIGYNFMFFLPQLKKNAYKTPPTVLSHFCRKIINTYLCLRQTTRELENEFSTMAISKRWGDRLFSSQVTFFML